jgi:AcrR family transcriptional regulator
MTNTSGQDKRNQILAAAQRVFDTCGYAATTMDAVAAEARLSKGSIYNYFRNKEDLFRQVFASTVEATEEHAGRLLAQPGSASERVERVLDFWFERLETNKKVGRLVLEFWSTAARQEQGTVSRQFQALYSRWRTYLEDVLNEGIRGREFHPRLNPHAGATLIMAVLDGIEVQCMLDVGVVVNADFLASLKRAVMSGLQNGPGDVAPGGHEGIEAQV